MLVNVSTCSVFSQTFGIMQSAHREWKVLRYYSLQLHLLLEQIRTFCLSHAVDVCAQLPLLTLPFLHQLMSWTHCSYISRKSTVSLSYRLASLFSGSAGKKQWHSCLTSSNGQPNTLVISWSTATLWFHAHQFLNGKLFHINACWVCYVRKAGCAAL